MTLRTFALALVMAVGGGAAVGTARGQDATQAGLAVAQQADRANQGFVGETAVAELELINAHGDVTKRRMAVDITEVASDGDRSLSVLQWPPDVQGTKLLIWTHKTKDDDRWLYMPSIKRVKRISTSNKSGSFMGSEFAYEDIGSQEVEKYTYKLLDEPELDGRSTWRLERYPVDKESGYSKQVVWIDKAYMGPLRIEYHDLRGTLLKVAQHEGYRQYGKYWRADVIRMDNAQTKKRSVLSWQSRRLGVSPPAGSFDSASLQD